jgi:hypothetical protein
MYKFGTMSMVYWDMAEQFRRMASEELQEKFYSRYVNIPRLVDLKEKIFRIRLCLHSSYLLTEGRLLTRM